MREAWDCGSLRRIRVSQICTVKRADVFELPIVGYIHRALAYCSSVMSGTAVVFRTSTARLKPIF
jgi:hypothetical protein